MWQFVATLKWSVTYDITCQTCRKLSFVILFCIFHLHQLINHRANNQVLFAILFLVLFRVTIIFSIADLPQFYTVTHQTLHTSFPKSLQTITTKKGTLTRFAALGLTPQVYHLYQVSYALMAITKGGCHKLPSANKCNIWIYHMLPKIYLLGINLSTCRHGFELLLWHSSETKAKENIKPLVAKMAVKGQVWNGGNTLISQCHVGGINVMYQNRFACLFKGGQGGT